MVVEIALIKTHAKARVAATIITGFIGVSHIREDADYAELFTDIVMGMEDILNLTNVVIKAPALPAK